MTFIVFIIILGVLVFVHELGHFLLAKKAGVKVEEFGFGYPPRAKILGEKWGTLFTLNWIPFGGFVKILGEDYEEGDTTSPTNLPSTETEVISFTEINSTEENNGFVLEEDIQITESFSNSRSQTNDGKMFTEVSKKWQAAILVAGVTFNILFAWLLFSAGFLIGLPTSAENDFNMEVKDPVLTVVSVLANSPAEKSGLKSGDKILYVSDENGKQLTNLNPDDTSKFVSSSEGEISLQVERQNKILDFKILPEEGLVENKKIIGISMDMVGTLRLPIHRAFIEGAKNTYYLTKSTIVGVSKLIKDGVTGRADMSQVTGPVGIVGMIGDARALGFAYLITFTALISVNLAIINLIPFPALDGGRVLIVAIEGITRKKINGRFVSTLNTIGFFLLIAMMLIVTYRDILKLF